MDKFVIIKDRKKNNVFGRGYEVNKITQKINNNEIFCIYGDSGVGKTFLIKEILKNYLFLEINHNILRSRSETNDFLETFKNRDTHLLIDDVETDLLGWKEIFEKIKNNNKISKGSLILIFKNNEKVSFVDSFFLEPLNIQQIIELGQLKYPKLDIEDIYFNAKKSKGNLRSFFYYFEFPDERDILLSPKDLIHKLLSPSELDIKKHIGQGVDEHGYSWNIVHENYPLSKNLNIHDIEYISECMSLADIYDNQMYHGEWQMFDYFCHEGIVCPCLKINQNLIRESLRPGSAWTKFNNMKMRNSKLKELNNRLIRTKIRIEEMEIIKNYCEHETIENIIKLLLKYNFKSHDLDLMNHLNFKNKLKPKVLNNIKKELKKYD